MAKNTHSQPNSPSTVLSKVNWSFCTSWIMWTTVVQTDLSTILKSSVSTFSNPRVILVYKQLSKDNEKDKRLGQVCVKYFVFKTYDSWKSLTRTTCSCVPIVLSPQGSKVRRGVRTSELQKRSCFHFCLF